MPESNLCSQGKPLWCSSVMVMPRFNNDNSHAHIQQVRTEWIYDHKPDEAIRPVSNFRCIFLCVSFSNEFLQPGFSTPGLLQLSIRQSILNVQESKRLSFYRPTGFRNIKGMRCAKKPRQVLTTLLWNKTIAQPFLHVGKTGRVGSVTPLALPEWDLLQSYNAMSQLCSDHRGIF